ncbi:MAG: DUF1761 domain-containing protein [Actinomycetota bacterium]
MSFDVLGDLNWLAVIVATVAYFAPGGLWFASPVFGRPWIRASGIQMPEGAPGTAFYVGPFATCLVATIATAMLVEATGSDTLGEGIVLGLVLGIGLALTTLFVTGIFDPKKPEPMVWFAITGGYHLIGLLIAGGTLATWT